MNSFAPARASFFYSDCSRRAPYTVGACCDRSTLVVTVDHAVFASVRDLNDIFQLVCNELNSEWVAAH